jgi:predicted GIY-YIG superfamily endonuclease
MHFVYIIYSENFDKYYIGETYEIEQRLMFHNSSDDNTNSTKSGIPWGLFLALQVENRSVARTKNNDGIKIYKNAICLIKGRTIEVHFIYNSISFDT